MKKLFLTMLGVVGMLCSTSCSDEEIVASVEGDAVAQFTVELSDGSDASRAISDGATVNTVYYEVWGTKNGTYQIISDLKDTAVIANKQATINLALVKGQTYDIVFWASKAGVYNTADLTSIAVNEGKTNDETKDAFTAKRTYTVNGPIKETVILRRPFAQINFGTPQSDLNAAKAAGAVIEQSELTVTNVATTYNALTEMGVGEKNYTFEINAIADTVAENLFVNGAKYEYLATAYVLYQGDSTATATSDLTMRVPTGLNQDVVLTVPTAPVQRNFRTNVLGNLLTNTADFNIVVDPIYTGDYPNTKEQELQFAAATGGKVTLTEDVTLTAPLQVLADFVLDLNGYNISIASGNAIQNKDNLTINGEGSVISATTYGVNNTGVLIVNGAKINAIYNAGEVTFNDGVVENTISGKHGIYHSGTKLVINDGEFSSTSGNELIHSATSNVTINGGTFTQIGKSYLFGNGNAGIVINGGVFNGYVNANGSNDKMRPGAAVVSGGTFNFDPTQWVATGYAAVDNGNGTYTVKKGVAANDVTSLGTALSNATPGSTILLSGNKDYGTVEVGELKGVTIEGNGKATMIFKTTADTKIENVTLNKINFEYTGATADCGIVIDANAQIDNLVVENCTFEGTGAKAGRGFSGFNNNASLVIKGCTFKDLGYPIYAWGGYESLTIEGCTFENIKSWAIMPQSGFDGDLIVTGCNFVNCLGGGLIKAGTLTAGHTFTFTDNVITGCTIAGDHNWFQFNVSAGTTVISGNLKDGQAWTPGTAEGLK